MQHVTCLARLFSLFLIAAGFICQAVAAPPKENWAIERIDNYLNRSVEQGFSGAVLIANGNQLVLKKGYGMADRNSDKPITTSTLFDIGSVTKQFTAAAIMVLETQGKLSVDDTLARFFPQVPTDKQGITLHQLLTHTSGLPAGIGLGDFTHIPVNEFINRVFQSALVAEPGQQYHYSNIGYSLLARIIEKVTDESYEAWLQENLFHPSGMNHTGYLLFDASDSRVAAGYRAGVLRTPSTLSRYQADGKIAWTLKGNGGLISSLDDMYSWYLSLKNHVVLTKAQLTRLTTRYVSEGGNSWYGYGWSLGVSPGGKAMVGHNGANGTYYFDFRWLTEEDIAIIYASNALMQDTASIGESLELMLFDHVFNPPSFTPGPVTRILTFASQFTGTGQALRQQVTTQFSDVITQRYVLNRAGLALLDSGKTNHAIGLLALNVENFADDGNLWDSLGEAYLKADLLHDAKVSFVNALVKAPEQGCYWCANARRRLESIKARERAERDQPVSSAEPATSGHPATSAEPADSRSQKP